jgi:hypothetical protein
LNEGVIVECSRKSKKCTELYEKYIAKLVTRPLSCIIRGDLK